MNDPRMVKRFKNILNYYKYSKVKKKNGKKYILCFFFTCDRSCDKLTFCYIYEIDQGT